MSMQWQTQQQIRYNTNERCDSGGYQLEVIIATTIENRQNHQV